MSIEEELKDLDELLDQDPVNLQRIASGLRIVKVDISELPPNQRTRYRDEFERIRLKFEKVKIDNLWKTSPSPKPPDTPKEMIDAASGIQDADLQILSRSRRGLQQSDEIGKETAQTLSMQTEQMGRIDHDLDKLEGQLKRGGRFLRSIMRKMVSDRIWAGFLLLITGGVVTIIAKKPV